MKFRKGKNNFLSFLLIFVFSLAGMLYPRFVLEGQTEQITLSNPQTATSGSVGSSITLSSYTVPSDQGSDLILAVWVGAEYGSHSEASSATFGGSAMTKVSAASTLYTTDRTNYLGGAFFWKVVNPGDSGNIIAYFPGTSVSRAGIHAITLSNVDVSGPIAATYKRGTTSPQYTSLSGLSVYDMIITGGANGDSEGILSAYGTGHTRDTSSNPYSMYAAQGHKEATDSSSGNIGWSATHYNRIIASLVAFTPAPAPINPFGVTTTAASNIESNQARLNGELTGMGVDQYEYEVILNRRTGQSCNTICSAVGKTCVSVGRDSEGTEGTYTSYWQSPEGACTSASNPDATCSLVMTASTYECYKYGKSTNCRCQLTITDVDVGFQWGTTTDFGNETSWQTVSATGTFYADISGLNFNTTYYFKAQAEKGTATTSGDTLSFTTSKKALGSACDSDSECDSGYCCDGICESDPCNIHPTITEVSDSPDPQEGGSTIIFNSTSSDLDDGDTVKLYVCKDSSCTDCGPSGTSNCWASSTSGVTSNASTSYICPSCATSTNNYWAKVCDEADDCSDITSSQSFSYEKENGCACSCGDGSCDECYNGYCCSGVCGSTGCSPTISTLAATSVGTSTVQLNGELLNLAGEDSAYVWFKWGETESYGNETASSTMDSTGTFNASLSGLEQGQTYHFIAMAGNDNGTSSSIDLYFTTIDGCGSHNISGWAWSENIGWVSFSCENCDSDNNGYVDSGACGGDNSSTFSIDYGVDMDINSGVLSGYAWSENIGWVSFNYSETGAPPGSPDYSSSGYIARTSTSTFEASGWARALAGSSAYSGGWKGWIKLRKEE
jgi:hypothetical protein